jgi:hypothetical protein
MEKKVRGEGRLSLYAAAVFSLSMLWISTPCRSDAPHWGIHSASEGRFDTLSHVLLVLVRTRRRAAASLCFRGNREGGQNLDFSIEVSTPKTSGMGPLSFCSVDLISSSLDKYSPGPTSFSLTKILNRSAIVEAL